MRRAATDPAITPEEIAELQAVMRMIEDRLEEALAEIPPRHRPLVPNALLNLAVMRILAADSPARTATILQRLADWVSAGERPDGDEALPLTGLDA